MIMVIINSNNVMVNFKLYHDLGDMPGTHQGVKDIWSPVGIFHLQVMHCRAFHHHNTNYVVVEGDMGA